MGGVEYMFLLDPYCACPVGKTPIYLHLLCEDLPPSVSSSHKMLLLKLKLNSALWTEI